MQDEGTYRLLTFWGQRPESKSAVGAYLIAQSADKMCLHGQRRGVMSRKESQGRIMIFGVLLPCASKFFLCLLTRAYPVLGGGSDCGVPGTCDNPNEANERTAICGRRRR